MKCAQIIGAVALALGMASAAPTGEGKTFKFGVTQSGTTQYLTKDGGAVSSMAEAVDCVISAGSLKCGGGSPPFFTGDMVQLKMTGSGTSSGWSIAEDDSIHWAGQTRKFSLRGKQIWAESCPHGHFPQHGGAKAYYAAQ